jgi:hypothetical protein
MEEVQQKVEANEDVQVIETGTIVTLSNIQRSDMCN